jgi:hypothetical protein
MHVKRPQQPEDGVFTSLECFGQATVRFSGMARDFTPFPPLKCLNLRLEMNKPSRRRIWTGEGRPKMFSGTGGLRPAGS